MKRLLYSLLILSAAHAQPTGSTFDEELFTWSRTFAELMHLVNTSYYIQVSPQEAMLQAMNAFVSFDPHSKFLDPKAYQAIKNVTTGKFFGIGVLLAPKEPADSSITVTDCLPQSPAEKAGIKPQDAIIGLDDTPLTGLTVDEVTDKIKGPQNSTVKITVIRKGQTKNINVKRDTIKDHDAFAYHLTDQNCTYIAIRTFTSHSAQHLENALMHAKKQRSKGLIIDVRDNTGGLLQAAVDCAALFLPHESIVVYTKNKDQKIIETFKTTRVPLTLDDMPIFILVNHQTASAAEIFAGSLKNNPKLFIFLLGTQTFGKGSVQPIFPLSNGCAVKLTHALYYLANGITIQGTGIEPDFVIEKKVAPSEETKTLTTLFGNESKLAKSIKTDTFVKTKKTAQEESRDWKTKLKKSVASDHHVQVALAYIELLTHARVAKPHEVNSPHKAHAYLFHHQPFNDMLDMEEIIL